MAKTAKRHDWTTPGGRDALDGDVKRTLLNTGALSRGDIAARIEIDTGKEGALKAVSASLRRGVRDGWATAHGELGRRTYSRAVAP